MLRTREEEQETEWESELWLIACFQLRLGLGLELGVRRKCSEWKTMWLSLYGSRWHRVTLVMRCKLVQFHAEQ